MGLPGRDLNPLMFLDGASWVTTGNSKVEQNQLARGERWLGLHPLPIKPHLTRNFRRKNISIWTSKCLTACIAVCSGNLAYFNAATQVGYTHKSIVVIGRKHREVSDLYWISTVLRNLNNSLSDNYCSYSFSKCLQHYLETFTYYFNRRFDLETLTKRLLIAVTQCAHRSNVGMGDGQGTLMNRYA